MPYRIMNGASKLFVPKDVIPQLRSAVCILPEWGDAAHADLHDVFHRFGFDVSEDTEGNITDLFLIAESLTDAQEAVAKAIAPFVKDGSYVMFIGEDAIQWAWVFRTNEATGAVEVAVEDVIPVLASEYQKLTAPRPDVAPAMPEGCAAESTTLLRPGAVVTSIFRGEHTGIVLDREDRQAWADTLAFPGRAPTSEEVRGHIDACAARGLSLARRVPVRWCFGTTDWEFIESLRPHRA